MRLSLGMWCQVCALPRRLCVPTLQPREEISCLREGISEQAVLQVHDGICIGVPPQEA